MRWHLGSGWHPYWKTLSGPYWKSLSVDAESEGSIRHHTIYSQIYLKHKLIFCPKKVFQYTMQQLGFQKLLKLPNSVY